jgi:hypothetical protein
MTKGHNKHHKSNDPHLEDKTKGQSRHLTNKEKKKQNEPHGRSADPDPSKGTKGQNAIE